MQIKLIFTRKVECELSLILKVKVYGTRKWPIVKLGSFGYINSQGNRVEKNNQAQRMQMRRLLFAVEPLCKIFVWRQVHLRPLYVSLVG